MKKEIKIGSVSWISDTPNPMYSTLQTQTLGPDWIPKTYLGLSATSNAAPADPLPDFKAYQGKKDFRAMTYCHFAVDIDDATGQVNSFSVKDAFHDGGWTPAFRMRSWPSTVLSFDTSIYSTTAYQGEYSSLSVVQTQAKHANSAISTVPATETVLVNALIKFRAGKHTDDVGINKVRSPFHVPWVWCETVLTYGAGKFKMYGRGSLFPSHAWYCNSKQITTKAQSSDAQFPCNRGPVPMLLLPKMPSLLSAHASVMPTPALSITVSSLNLYPVLSKGAPASGPQAPASAESTRTGAVDTHANTAAGGTAWSQVVV